MDRHSLVIHRKKHRPISQNLLTKEKDGNALRKTILELVKKDHVHSTELRKKDVQTCLSFATSNTIRKQFYRYLLLNGYLERVSRGIYKITGKGELLEILDQG